METTENTQVEAVSERLLEQDHQAKRHKILICDIQQESFKEMPPKLPHGNSKQRLRKLGLGTFNPKTENRTKPNQTRVTRNCIFRFSVLGFGSQTCTFLDVATRWNSTFKMLVVAVAYEKVFVRYADDDPY
jgi:hypothetical protein